MGNKFSNLDYCNEEYQDNKQIYGVFISYNKDSNTFQSYSNYWNNCLENLKRQVKDENLEKKIRKYGYFNNKDVFCCIFLPNQDNTIYSCKIIHSDGIRHNVFDLKPEKRIRMIMNIKDFLANTFPECSEDMERHIDSSFEFSNSVQYSIGGASMETVSITIYI